MDSLFRLLKASDAAVSLGCWSFLRSALANDQLVYMKYTKNEVEKYRVIGDFGELQDTVLWNMN